MLELFILKLLDNCLSTLKTTFLVRNENFLSSLFNALSTLSYMLLIVTLSKHNSLIDVTVVSFATFLGSYIPLFLEYKLSKDNAWIFNIIPSTNKQAKELADDLRDNNIAVQTYKGYNNKEQTLCIKAFSENRKESVLLEQLIPKDCTYHIVELKGYNAN